MAARTLSAQPSAVLQKTSSRSPPAWSSAPGSAKTPAPRSLRAASWKSPASPRRSAAAPKPSPDFPASATCCSPAPAPAAGIFRSAYALGQGKSLDSILASRSSVTEGIATAPALLARAQSTGTEMPITEAVTKLLTNERSIGETMAVLMGRALKDE